jgi:ABC-type nitrate/sulfonate/bicarbonate transport system permease component
LFAVGWEGARWLGLVNPALFPPLWEVAVVFGDGILDGSVFSACLYSLYRVVLGFFLGMSLAVGAGVCVTASPILRALANPLLAFFATLPPISLIPLSVFVFGVGEESKLAILVFAAFFQGLVGILGGLARVTPDSPLFSTFPRGRWLAVVVTASQTSFTICWTTLMSAEIFSARKGLGALVSDGQNFRHLPSMFLGIFLIGLMAAGFAAGLRFLERRVRNRG